MKYQTEEKFLHSMLEQNSKATWFIEANQIECTYKSPIVMADQSEGTYVNINGRMSALPRLYSPKKIKLKTFIEIG